MLCWSRRRRPRTTIAAARWTISCLCSNVPVIPYRAALPKSSLDIASACTSVLRALTGIDDHIRFIHRSCAYAVRQVRLASFFFGVRIMLGTILGRFSIIYFRGLGLRIKVMVWVMFRARGWVRVGVGVGVRVSVVLWSW